MAKKPMTKSQIVSHFAGNFELTKKTASGIIEEVAALAVSETKKTGSFTIPGIGKLVLVRKLAWDVIRLPAQRSRFLLRLWLGCR
jgi:nucleoid DNA-binding protein